MSWQRSQKDGVNSCIDCRGRGQTGTSKLYLEETCDACKGSGSRLSLSSTSADQANHGDDDGATGDGGGPPREVNQDVVERVSSPRIMEGTDKGIPDVSNQNRDSTTKRLSIWMDGQEDEEEEMERSNVLARAARLLGLETSEFVTALGITNNCGVFTVFNGVVCLSVLPLHFQL